MHHQIKNELMKILSIDFKMRFLSIVTILVYVYLMISSFSYEWEDFKIGLVQGANNNVEAFMNDDPLSLFSVGDIYYLTLKPKKSIFNFPDKMKNQIGEVDISYRPYKVKMKLPEDVEKSASVKLLEVLCLLLSMALFLILVVLPFPAFKLFRSMKSGVLFDERNVSWARTVGVMLVIGFFVLLVSDILYVNVLRSLFDLVEYKIVRDALNLVWLLCGCLFFVFAEVLNNGMKIKSENDLTV